MEFLILVSAAILISLTLGFLYFTAKYYFVKPSIIFIAFFNIFLQWPAVYYYHLIESSLSSSRFGFILMFSLAPFSALLISLLFRESARKVYRGLDITMNFPAAVKLLLLCLVLLGPIIYFQYVSIYKTGLASILRGDSYTESSMIREQSLKMLPALPRYFHSMSTRVFSFLLIIILIDEVSRISNFFIKTWKICLIFIIIIFTVLFLAIDGSRAPGALVFMYILFFILYRGKINLNRMLNLKYLSILIMIVGIPAVLEYMRADSKDVMGTMNTFIDRLFYIRFESGILNVKYSEIYGNWGVAAMGNLSPLFGVKGVNVANFVANMEYYGPVESGLANASFMMTYYAYFGILAVPLSVGLILMLDGALWFVANRVRSNLFVYSVVGYTMAIYGLVDADYTTIFITHGLLINLLLMYSFSKFLFPKDKSPLAEFKAG